MNPVVACTLRFDDEDMLAIVIRALAYSWRFIMLERAFDVHDEVLPWFAN